MRITHTCNICLWFAQLDSIIVDFIVYSKTCVKRPLSRRPKIGFQDQLLLMQVESVAECSKGAFCNIYISTASLKVNFYI